MANKRLNIPIDHFTESSFEWQRKEYNDFYEHPEVTKRMLVCHRRARKTTLALNLAISEAFANKKETYAYVMPTNRQAKAVMWRDPKMIQTYLPREILKKPFNESELVAEFRSGSVIHFMGAEDIDRLRGLGCKGWVLDEWATMRNGQEIYEEIIYPIILANHGWTLFPFTPKGRNHAYKYFAEKNEAKDWRIVHMPASVSGILTPDEIKDARRNMPEHLFNQELECQFLAEGGGVIRRVREAIDGNLQPYQENHRYVMGVDLGKHVDWTVISVLDMDSRHLAYFDRFQKLDWGLQKQQIAAASLKYHNPLIVLDSTGIGDPIEDDLKRMGLNIRGFKFTSTSKRQIVEKLILAIEGRRVTYPDIKELVQELEDFDIDDHGSYGAPAGLHDDTVMSLALAVEGLGAEVYTVERNPEDSYSSYEDLYPGAREVA